MPLQHSVAQLESCTARSDWSSLLQPAYGDGEIVARTGNPADVIEVKRGWHASISVRRRILTAMRLPRNWHGRNKREMLAETSAESEQAETLQVVHFDLKMLIRPAGFKPAVEPLEAISNWLGGIRQRAG